MYTGLMLEAYTKMTTPHCFVAGASGPAAVPGQLGLVGASKEFAPERLEDRQMPCIRGCAYVACVRSEPLLPVYPVCLWFGVDYLFSLSWVRSYRIASTCLLLAAKT